MTKLIELNDVSVRYGTCEALSHVYLDIHPQDFLGIIGPNGGGKTTLVKAILKAVPYTGKVIYSKEIESGGYRPDTPAAVVYKATWPEQKVVRCTVSTLAEETRKNGITKTALIVVGDFLGENYERSKLYDPAFTTEFRQGTEAGQ